MVKYTAPINDVRGLFDEETLWLLNTVSCVAILSIVTGSTGNKLCSVLLAEDIAQFSELIRRTGLDELRKPETREKIGGRIQLLHTVIQTGLLTLLSQAPEPEQSAQDAEA